jgi:ribonuclease E
VRKAENVCPPSNVDGRFRHRLPYTEDGPEEATCWPAQVLDWDNSMMGLSKSWHFDKSLPDRQPDDQSRDAANESRDDADADDADADGADADGADDADAGDGDAGDADAGDGDIEAVAPVSPEVGDAVAAASSVVGANGAPLVTDPLTGAAHVLDPLWNLDPATAAASEAAAAARQEATARVAAASDAATTANDAAAKADSASHEAVAQAAEAPPVPVIATPPAQAITPAPAPEVATPPAPEAGDAAAAASSAAAAAATTVGTCNNVCAPACTEACVAAINAGERLAKKSWAATPLKIPTVTGPAEADQATQAQASRADLPRGDESPASRPANWGTGSAPPHGVGGARTQGQSASKTSSL